MGYFGGTYESAKTDECKEFNRMNKENSQNKCRTTAIKPTFLWLLCNSKSYGNKKSGTPELNLSYTTLVGIKGG